MNQKQLEEAIGRGVTEGVTEGILKSLFYIGLVWIISSVILIGWGIIPDKNEDDIIAIAGPSCFPYENLECYVVLGNSTEDFLKTSYFEVCGYQEANAKFEQIKPTIEEQINRVESLYPRNTTIKYLICE